ncbi:hypothetical protein [Gandjariella thermophila]|uniref:hypothetical protein n=1 Tax=Gandjariella thermophila TaxID=1931992 RepID=UPI001863AE54|nr:hypothetical protein [Gandjariella thermophila]
MAGHVGAQPVLDVGIELARDVLRAVPDTEGEDDQRAGADGEPRRSPEFRRHQRRPH